MTSTGPKQLSIAREFSETPGPRHPAEGDFSGEEFFRACLQPRYLEARREGMRLRVDLDGTEGYATSFLEEAFGGLARAHPPEEVLETLELKCEDEPALVEEIRRYILEARVRT